jgi:hypothetical protein
MSLFLKIFLQGKTQRFWFTVNLGGVLLLLGVVFLVQMLGASVAFADWDFSNHAIPLADIQSGGPPRDGIPALTEPSYLTAAQADFMQDEDQVIGVNLNGVIRAYPTKILSWHELVNERFGDLPVLVSW